LIDLFGSSGVQSRQKVAFPVKPIGMAFPTIVTAYRVVKDQAPRNFIGDNPSK